MYVKYVINQDIGFQIVPKRIKKRTIYPIIIYVVNVINQVIIFVIAQKTINKRKEENELRFKKMINVGSVYQIQMLQSI